MLLLTWRRYGIGIRKRIIFRGNVVGKRLDDAFLASLDNTETYITVIN